MLEVLAAILSALVIVFIVEFVAPARDRGLRLSFGLPVRSHDSVERKKVTRTRLLRGAVMVPFVSYGLNRAIEQSQTWTILTGCVLFVYVVFANWRAMFE